MHAIVLDCWTITNYTSMFHCSSTKSSILSSPPSNFSTLWIVSIFVLMWLLNSDKLGFEQKIHQIFELHAYQCWTLEISSSNLITHFRFIFRTLCVCEYYFILFTVCSNAMQCSKVYRNSFIILIRLQLAFKNCDTQDFCFHITLENVFAFFLISILI